MPCQGLKIAPGNQRNSPLELLTSKKSEVVVGNYCKLIVFDFLTNVISGMSDRCLARSVGVPCNEGEMFASFRFFTHSVGCNVRWNLAAEAVL